MVNLCKLIVTDSYFGVFDILNKTLKDKKKGLNGRNLVFCEDKVSLMAERALCANGEGTFNTDVYSFGKFLHIKKPNEKALSKEGASMAVKRLLSTVNLKRFSASRTSLAPALHDLIIQLKSANVTPQDILGVVERADGLLKHKLEDIFSVYSEYEKFLCANGYFDQSALLSTLPDVIENDAEVAQSDVYLVGYRSWTAQAREVIKSLMHRAKSVTAILTAGDNELLYLNETVESFRSLCKSVGVRYKEEKIASEFSPVARTLKDNLFCPTSFVKERQDTRDVFVSVSATVMAEVEKNAQVIKGEVIEGRCRYNDFTVAIPENDEYKSALKQAFKRLEIPFFLDERKAPKNHPIIALIFSYIEVFRKNFERDAFIAFIKNPLVCKDKLFADRLENYLVKYNVNRAGLKKPFVFGGADEVAEFNEFCKKIMSVFGKLDIRGMLNYFAVQDRLQDFTARLSNVNEAEISAVNKQIYDAVIGLIDQIDLLLGDMTLSVTELKQIFSSGVSALELSIIPQYTDAVFVGGYKEVALAKTKYLFAMGLDSSVPDCAPDIALLSDGDISSLESLNLLVEPKIKIVNDRERESVGLAVTAFSDKLFLSYAGTEGQNESEIISYVKKLFTVKKLNFKDEYLTEKQGYVTFAKAFGEYADGHLEDFELPSAFYKAASAEIKNKIDAMLDSANREIKIRLNIDDRSLIGGVVSPTYIEGYYACPYKAFLSRVIKLQERESGDLAPNIAGDFLHAVLEKYILRISTVTDKPSSDALVEEIVNEIIVAEKYLRLTVEAGGENDVNRLIDESKKHCFTVFKQYSRSKFKNIKVEQWIDKEKAVKLLGGRVKLLGKIDRVDEYGDYVRIIDYKSGANVDCSDSELFSGRKLQLYLYASTFSDKTLAGAYYYKLGNNYEKTEDKKPVAIGKTLSDKAVIEAQDSAFYAGESDFFNKGRSKLTVSGEMGKEALDAYMKYAVRVSENAAKQLDDGVIVASPYKDTCQYCAFKGICGSDKLEDRKVGKISDGVIISAVENNEADGGEK